MFPLRPTVAFASGSGCPACLSYCCLSSRNFSIGLWVTQALLAPSL